MQEAPEKFYGALAQLFPFVLALGGKLLVGGFRGHFREKLLEAFGIFSSLSTLSILEQIERYV